MIRPSQLNLITLKAMRLIPLKAIGKVNHKKLVMTMKETLICMKQIPTCMKPSNVKTS